MERKAAFLLLLLLLVVSLGALDEELPDVEITGPSALHSVLEKRGLSGEDLLLPDVTDSLQTLLPAIPEESLPVPLQKLHWLYFKAGYNWDFHGCFLADSLFTAPLSFRAEAQRLSYEEAWKQLALRAVGQYSGKNHRVGVQLKKVYSKSEYNIDYQSVNALSLNLDFNNIRLFAYPVNLSLNGEVQTSHYQYLSSDSESDLVHFNHRVGLSGKLSHGTRFFADLYYAYHTPALSLRLGFPAREESDFLDFAKGISIWLADHKVSPGAHISQRFIIDDRNFIQIYQESDLQVQDNYSLLLRQPWQKQREDAFVTFRPLNAHVIFYNSAIRLHERPLNLSLDLSVRYLMDGPVYSLANPDDGLPTALPRDILASSATLKGVYRSGSTFFSQSVVLEQDLLDSATGQPVPYVPLLSLETELSQAWEPVRLAVWLRQYYATENDLGEKLDNAMDLGGELDYSLTKDFNLFVELSNLELSSLLNRGKYVFRTLPSPPTVISLGFRFGF
jgi:hypothetical protein